MKMRTKLKVEMEVWVEADLDIESTLPAFMAQRILKCWAGGYGSCLAGKVKSNTVLSTLNPLSGNAIISFDLDAFRGEGGIVSVLEAYPINN